MSLAHFFGRIRPGLFQKPQGVAVWMVESSTPPPIYPTRPESSFVKTLKRVFAPVVVVLVAGGKYLAPLLKFGLPLLKTGGTMFLSIWIYARFYGWQFAVGFVLLLLVHECGHLVGARLMGLKVGAPVFIPFMGAVIALKEAPRNAWIEAVVGIGGPLLGSAGALAVWSMGFVTGHPFWFALGYTGMFLNLFNLIPIVPLDGGRIVTAISPWLWLVGVVIAVPFLLWYWTFVSLMILLIVGSSIPRVLRLFRNRSEEEARFFECTRGQRLTISALYFGLLAGLGAVMTLSHTLELIQ